MDGTETALLLVVIVATFPFAFAALLFVVMSILAAVGGWGRVADRFRGAPVVGGTGGQSGSFGLVQYRFVLTVAPSPQGLGLSVMWFFRFAHPPLLIPWAEVHNATEKSTLLGPAVMFDVGQPPLARVRLPRAALGAYADSLVAPGA